MRGDGKEFSFAAKSVAVPLTDLSVTGALAPPPSGTAPTVRAGFGEIRIDAPVARLTRTKDGIVLPGRPRAVARRPSGRRRRRRGRARAAAAGSAGARTGRRRRSR